MSASQGQSPSFPQSVSFRYTCVFISVISSILWCDDQNFYLFPSVKFIILNRFRSFVPGRILEVFIGRDDCQTKVGLLLLQPEDGGSGHSII